jgi:hypothetical protein
LAVLLLITIIFTSLFYVLTRRQKPDIRAVTLDEEEYGIGGRAILTVRNVWESTILVGVEYGLYRKVDGSWVSVLVKDERWTAASRVHRGFTRAPSRRIVQSGHQTGRASGRRVQAE